MDSNLAPLHVTEIYNFIKSSHKDENTKLNVKIK